MVCSGLNEEESDEKSGFVMHDILTSDKKCRIIE